MAVIRDLSVMTSPEVEAALPLRLPALLPLGACEQHGAHLPLSVDTDLALGVARGIAERTGALLLPPMAYGEAWSMDAYPGTLSLSPDTLRAVLTDLGRGLRRTGASALILVNGHFGNRAPAALAARTLLEEGLPVLLLDHPGLEDLARDLCESAPAGPGLFHADEVETSMMLALRPEAVRMERAEPGYPDLPATFGMEPMGFRALAPGGVLGDPRPATAAKGQALLDGVVAAALPLIDAFLLRHGLPAGPWPR